MDFYAINRKRLIDARKIYNNDRIQLLLKNAYLSTLLRKYLIAAIDNKDTEIEYSNELELVIRRKDSGDCFHLTFIDANKINITIDTSNEYTKIDVLFDDEESRINFNKEVTVPQKTRTLLEKTIERKTYIDNDLRYEYIYYSYEYSYQGEFITVIDTYIDLDNNAVIQKMELAGDKNKQKDMKLEYFETNSYYALPFNDLVRFSHNKSKEMVPSTREAFYEFVNGSNNISPIL